MADEIPEAQISQPAVLEGKVSDPYEMQSTQAIDLARREAEANKTPAQKQADRDAAFDAADASPYADAEDNTESLGNFVGVSSEYKNYGGVSHEPLEAEGGVEKTVTDRLLAAQAALAENSKKATGGHTTYGESREADPVGRSGDIVRGGTGDENTARGATPSKPATKSEGAAKKAAAAKE